MNKDAEAAYRRGTLTGIGIKIKYIMRLYDRLRETLDEISHEISELIGIVEEEKRQEAALLLAKEKDNE